MKLYAVFLGSRRLRKAARFTAVDDRRLCEATATHFPSDFTIVAAKGTWWNARTQRLEREESREIHVSAKRIQRVRKWARSLGKLFGQQEVLLVEVGRSHVIKIKRPGKRPR